MMRTAARAIALTLNTLLLVYMLWSLYLVSHLLSWRLVTEIETWFHLIPLAIGILTPVFSFIAILGSPESRRELIHDNETP
jgi:hypothetical protein